MINSDRRITIMNQVKDLVGKFLYYDRKEDEDLPIGQIEKAIQVGDITVDEIVKCFSSTLMKLLRDEDQDGSNHILRS